jgi:hypothetical protein
VLEMLVEPQPRTSLSKDARQRGLPYLDRLAPQVHAVQFEQVDDVEEASDLRGETDRLCVSFQRLP